MENKIITIRNVYGKVKEVHFQPCRQENGTPWPFVKPVRYDANGNSELILSDKERNDPNNKYFIPEDMDIVVKESPINDENNKKKAGYYISDQLTLFYFKYIYRNLSRLAVMDSDVFYEKFIKNDFEEHYVPKTFEQVCKQFLIRKNRLGELEDSFEKIGKYYYDDPVNHKNGEFDIVTESDSSYIFYDAKFRNEKLDKNLIYTEIKQVNDTGLVCKKYGFFSKSGYKEIDDKYKTQLILYSIEDLFSED